MNFATLQGLTIPEGVVTQIADASGRVLWAVSGGKVILEVEKITSDTYAGETTYTGEQFILLDIYPKTNGTVNVTYGGLTKTITDTSGAEEPNAQRVFFGTFNGVSDSVTTPVSGELTIEGDLAGFGMCFYSTGSKSLDSGYCSCIRAIIGWGKVELIPEYAFWNNSHLTNFDIPNTVKKIGYHAFSSEVESVKIPYSVYSIEKNPFSYNLASSVVSISEANDAYKMIDNCLIEIATSRLISFFADSVIIPSGVKAIGWGAITCDSNRKSITFPESLEHFEESSVNFGFNDGCDTVIMLSLTPPTGVGLGFANTGDNFQVIVPKGCGDAYKAADGWNIFPDRIVEAS